MIKIKYSKTWLLVLGMLVVAITGSFWVVDRIEMSNADQEHSYRTVNQAEVVLSFLKDAETGERGLLLTGNRAHLQPYLEVIDEIELEFAALRSMVTDAQQLQRLALIEPLVKERVMLLKGITELYLKGHIKESLNEMASSPGKAVMDAIRVGIADFTETEQATLRLRTTQFRDHIQQLLRMVAACAIAAVFIAAVAAIRIQQLSAEAQRKAAFQNTLLDSAEVAVISTTTSGIISSFNRFAEQLLGYSQTELVGKKSAAVLHDENEIAERAAELQSLTGGPVAPGFEVFSLPLSQNKTEAREWTYICKDGRRITVALSTSPMYEKNRIIGYLGIARDVTELKKAEAVARSRAAELTRFKSALDQAHDCIFLFDPDTLRFTYANRGALEQVGYTHDQLLQMGPLDIKPEFMEASFRELILPIRDGTVSSLRFETVHRHQDGRDIPVEVFLQYVCEPGQNPTYVNVVRDIAERKQAERRLIAARDEAHKANAAKDVFLATMSHEMRTPLNGLLGMLELLAFTKMDAEQRNMLATARNSGAGLVRILDDVLDHAKIEAGKLDIRLEPARIDQIVGCGLQTYEPLLHAKQLAMTKWIDPQIGQVMVDPMRLMQVIGNLVSNAIKFTEAGSVDVSVNIVSRTDRTITVRFSVKDTGIGIGAEGQARLFQPFQQATSDTTRLYGGTGLGLNISRRLATMMGGRLDMSSQIGVGTTMELTLEFSVADGAAPTETTANRASTIFIDTDMLDCTAPLSSHSPSVLVVDDHPTNRKLLARQLALLGIKAKFAESGMEAFKLWQSQEFALIVTDCNMPGMDGYMLTREIRAAESTLAKSRIPIIGWTANVLSIAAGQCHAAGMDDVLSKPANIKATQAVLCKWLPEREKKPTATDDFNELRELAGSAAERNEIFQDFIAHIRSDFASLTIALESKDIGAVKHRLHRMRGSCQLVGAHSIAQYCEAMEQQLGEGALQQTYLEVKKIELSITELESLQHVTSES